MGEYSLEGDDLKKMLAFARKGPVSFAFNPGKSDDDQSLAMHKLKSVAVLAKAAKAEGGGSKVASGTCEVKSKELHLTCEDVVPGIARKLKRFLKANGAKLNVVVLDAEGNLLESDIEDIEDAAGELSDAGIEGGQDEPPVASLTESEGGPSAPAADRAQLTERLKRVREKLAAVSPEQVPPLAEAFRKVVEMVRAEEVARATAGLDRIEAALDRLGQAGASDPGLDAGALVARIRALRDRIAAMPPPLGPRLSEVLASAMDQMRAQRLPEAAATLDRIEAAMASLKTEAPAPDPAIARVADAAAQLREQVAALPASDAQDGLTAELDKADTALAQGDAKAGVAALKRVQDGLRLQAEIDRLAPLVSVAATQGKVADPSALRTLFGVYSEQVPAADHAKAMAGLARVEAMIAAGVPGGASQFEAEIGAEVRPFATSRVLWANTRSGLRGEMARLQNAIVSTCSDDEDLAEVVAAVPRLMDYLTALDERLETKLDEIVNAPAGPGRDKAKVEARQILADYQAELETPFYQVVDNGNGFQPVAIASQARSALADIAKVLAA